MWNPFRRRRPEAAFPKPKWPPIQNLDSIDIFGKRRDGGLDLCIVASQPLDGDAETLESIRHKVSSYLTAIRSEKFQAEMGYRTLEQTTIIIACDHPIHPVAMAVIEECKALAAGQGVRLKLQKSTARFLGL